MHYDVMAQRGVPADLIETTFEIDVDGTVQILTGEIDEQDQYALEDAGLRVDTSNVWHLGADWDDEEEPDYDSPEYYNSYLEDNYGFKDPWANFDYENPVKHVTYDDVTQHQDPKDMAGSDATPSEMAMYETEAADRPIIFNGQRWYMGEPNSHHWDLIRNEPELQKHFDTSQDMGVNPEKAAALDWDTLAYGRYNDQTQRAYIPYQGHWRRDHMEDVINQSFNHPDDLAEDYGQKGSGTEWDNRWAEATGDDEWHTPKNTWQF